MKLLIVADVHANWAALQAVAEAEADAAAVVNLGDLVVNGPSPVECVDWARTRADWSVLGNHDLKIQQSLSGQLAADGSRARALARLHARMLGPERVDWLTGLPELVTFHFGGCGFTAVHGSMTDHLNGSLGPTLSPLLLRQQLDLAHSEVLLFGHTHVPFTRTYHQMTLFNPGSVGQPRDGDPRAQYGVWQDGVLEHRRVAYDVAATISALQAGDYPAEYQHELAEGWRLGRNPAVLTSR